MPIFKGVGVVFDLFVCSCQNIQQLHVCSDMADIFNSSGNGVEDKFDDGEMAPSPLRISVLFSKKMR